MDKIINIHFDAVKAAKARLPSTNSRDKEGKVIRLGKNLSGNQPFAKKTYEVTAEAPEIAVRAAPNQVQLILKYMKDTSARGTGAEIVEGAISAGYLRTKIEPAVLFAYYRKLLEKLGVEHVG